MNTMDFTDLLRAGKEEKDYKNNIRLAIVGNASTQHLATSIKGYGALKNIGIEIFDSGFRQEKAQILDHDSELYTFNPEVVLIYWATETIYEEFLNTSDNNRKFFAESKILELRSFYDALSKYGISVIQSNLPEYNDNVYGSFSLKREDSFYFQIHKLNYLILELLSEYDNAYAADFASIPTMIGRERYFDPKMYVMGELTISLSALPQVAKTVVDVLLAIKGKIKKCIILDLDNTLWGGVIGDDGLENIKIGELGTGKAYVAFQKWLLELKNRGILLAVVSKNELEAAEKPFREHPDMILSLDDFVAFVANWESKADNIKNIQKKLNIGMDSIIFIDDSKFEREVVKSQIPEIEVPELPEDPCSYVIFLSNQNYFETVSASDEDKNRTKQYKIEAERSEEEAKYVSYEDYLKSLEMEGVCKPFDAFHIPRIAQLSQRSNQFNLRTIRMTENDVKDIITSDDKEGIYFELKDKYGDYGMIGYVVLEKRDDYVFISNWVMSCRVLKRTMEEFILNHIISSSEKFGLNKVRGEYLPTEKNILVRELYPNFGFYSVDTGFWETEITKYVNKNSFIKEVS